MSDRLNFFDSLPELGRFELSECKYDVVHRVDARQSTTQQGRQFKAHPFRPNRLGADG